jgi:hypothetical protein
MAQASIVQAGENPSLLRGTEREADVCGDCRGQKRLDGWCYEDWQPWLIGQRRHLAVDVPLRVASELLRGRAVRLGAYGDPAAVPFGVWKQLLVHATGWTGYTHAWRRADPRFRSILMASADSHPDAIEAELAGWRYFRIRRPGAPVLRSEVVCANESRGRTCLECRLCAGAARPAKNVAITVHGPRVARFVRPGRAA